MKYLMILILGMNILFMGCKKPVEETILGKWYLIHPDDKNCCNDRVIEFRANSTVKKSHPLSGSSGNWYLVNGEVFFDTEYTYYLDDGPWSGDVTCNVTYQVVDCKRNKLWIKDISSSLCGEVNYYDNELGNTWEYKRVK